MPGRVATFATWSTARSWTALAMRSSEANTTPGTRIPSTVPTGIRHTNGSTRSGSIMSGECTGGPEAAARLSGWVPRR